jgi:hypothetical protein
MWQDTKNPQKNDIPFIELLKEAGRIVWKNKFLLWFGLLIALGSPGSFNMGNSDDWNGKGGDTARNFIETHWQVVLAVALVIFAIGIALFLISLVGKAGLIRSVSLIVSKKKTSFKAGWKEGKKYLGKLVKLFLLFFAATLVIILVLGLPVVYLAATGSWISAILVGMLAVAILAPLIFVLALTNIFSEFYIVLSDLGVWSAVESGYNLLLKNIKNSIIFGLLLMAVSIVAGLVLLPVALIVAAVLIPAGTLFYFMNKIAFAIFLIIAIFLFLLAILFISSVFAAYKTTAWTLFFREIAKAESEETAKISETEPEEEIAVAPEKA